MPGSDSGLPDDQKDFLQALLNDLAMQPAKLTDQRAFRRMIGAQISESLILIAATPDFLRAGNPGGITEGQQRQHRSRLRRLPAGRETGDLQLGVIHPLDNS